MAISKTRMRMEQIKGGKLQLTHGDSTALEITALETVSGSPGDAKYLKVDASNGAEKIELGSADSDRPTGIQLDGDILNGAAVVYASEGLANNNVDTKLPSAAAVKAYVDSTGTSFIIEDEDGTEVQINNNKEIKLQGGPGLTINYTDTDTGDDTDPFDLDFNIDAAQTEITSLFAADIKIGEDDETKIDFETADEIHFYAANAEQVYVADGIFGPQTDSAVDLGSSGVRFKDAYVDTVKASGNAEIIGTLDLGHATDNTLSASSGDLSIQGNRIFREGGADIPVADGGTGTGSFTAGQVLIGDGTNAIQTKAIGIGNGELLQSNANVADNDFLRIDGTSVEGLTASEVMGALSGQMTSGTTFSFNDNLVTNIKTPTADHHAATKSYVDGMAQGISAKKAVRLRTSASGGDILPEKASYKAAPASLTFNSVDLLGTSAGYSIAGRDIIVKTNSGAVEEGILASSKTDGKQVFRGDRLLVMNEQSDRQAAHGIYDVVHPGSDAAANAKIEIGFGGGLPSDSDYILFRKLEGYNANEIYRIAFQSANVVSQPTAFGAAGATIPGEKVVSLALSVGGSSRSANDLASDIRTLLGSINSSGDFNGWSVGGTGNVVQFEKSSSQEISDDVYLEKQIAGAGPAVDVFAFSPSGGMPYLLVRSSDSDAVGDHGGDPDSNFELGGGSFVFVQEGTSFADTGFVCSSDLNLTAHQTLDEGAKLNFVQFSSAGTITASNGVDRLVNDIQLDLKSLTADDVSLAATDRLAYMDDADADKTKSVTLSALLDGVAGVGLVRDAAGLKMDIDELPAAAIEDNDTIGFHDLNNTAGSKKTTTRQLAALLAGGSEFEVTSGDSTLELADGSVALGRLADAAANTVIVRDAASSGALSAKAVVNEQILIGDGTGFTAAALSGDVAMDNAGVVTIQAQAVHGTMLNSDTADGSTLGLSSNTLSVLAVPNSLTVDNITVQLNSGTTFDGAAARTISIKGGAITQDKRNYVEAYIASTSGISDTVDLRPTGSGGSMTYAESSVVSNMSANVGSGGLVPSVDNGNVQNLNQRMNLKVHLNGQLLMPDISDDGDGDADFDLASADYKFYIDSGAVKLKFNGAIIENGDCLRISGLAFG